MLLLYVFRVIKKNGSRISVFQNSTRSIVRRRKHVIFQPFDQEGLRVDSLHLAVDPNATFRLRLLSLKAMTDQFVSEGVLIPNISCSHSSLLNIVYKMEGYSNGSRLSGGQSISLGIF